MFENGLTTFECQCLNLNYLNLKFTDYKLRLTASSPIALDSNAKFTALLLWQNGTAVGSKLYKYTWDDDVMLSRENVTTSNEYAELFKTYPHELTLAENYSMKVRVTDNEKQVEVANGSIHFEMTGTNS